MALKTVIPFPIFAPNLTTSTTTPATSTQLRFSRWNNANAENFNRRPQHLIEDELRRLRRFESALNISNNPSPNPHPPTTPSFRSTGTPSSPSLSSIPGKKSKYSKPQKPPPHPAFRKVARRTRLPEAAPPEGETEVKVREEGGLGYVVPGAPFEFMYSYTETPRVKPVGLREPAVAPFAPGTMPRPWTGRKPLPGSKKLLKEFDSFKPPPAGKKGVKTVQQPGPYLPGSGPRYVTERQEVLGEALTEEEVKELVEGCRKAKRQLNMGRDGLTHNMLDNIHAHWKRRRVCKIKCKGVCTVDMDNVCEQLEEKTGGKIIYRRGGIVYLFRGRNYNYKTRPRFPLMLWKPVSPMYPRLIKRVPEGLTLEEASDMRKRGRDLVPICKLGKNGVYVNLAKSVKEAFEACELVRINCQGLNPSDYRKIGAKLKDLVPCVLLSFENEHILMWRGRDWKSSFLLPEDGGKKYQMSESDREAFLGSDTADPLSLEDEQESSSCSSIFSNEKTSGEISSLTEVSTNDSEVGAAEFEDTSFVKEDVQSEIIGVIPYETNVLGSQTLLKSHNPSDVDIVPADHSCEGETRIVDDFSDEEPTSAPVQSVSGLDTDCTDELKDTLGNSFTDSATSGKLQGAIHTSLESCPSTVASSCTEGVLFLLKQAIDSGSAVTLDENSLDADVVYERSVAFSEVAPPGPVFMHRPRKVVIQKCESQERGNVELEKAVLESEPEMKSNAKKPKERKSFRTQKPIDFKEKFLDVVPQGSLKIDELAKLLA